MRIVLIRHGLTKGNEEKRYVGKTDEPLSETGRRNLLQRKAEIEKRIKDEKWQKCDSPMIVYTSSLKRCVESARILFPEAEIEMNASLNEMDFGEYEYKNYQDLKGECYYQSWIDSGGILPFPNGEDKEHFCRRVCEGFINCMTDYRSRIKNQQDENETVVFVLHGGSIMAILEKYAELNKSYYEYQCENGMGYIGQIDEQNRIVLEE